MANKMESLGDAGEAPKAVGVCVSLGDYTSENLESLGVRQ